MLVKSVEEEVVANVCSIMEVKRLNNVQLYVESSIFFSNVFQHSCREFLQAVASLECQDSCLYLVLRTHRAVRSAVNALSI